MGREVVADEVEPAGGEPGAELLEEAEELPPPSRVVRVILTNRCASTGSSARTNTSGCRAITTSSPTASRPPRDGSSQPDYTANVPGRGTSSAEMRRFLLGMDASPGVDTAVYPDSIDARLKSLCVCARLVSLGTVPSLARSVEHRPGTVDPSDEGRYAVRHNRNGAVSGPTGRYRIDLPGRPALPTDQVS